MSPVAPDEVVAAFRPDAASERIKPCRFKEPGSLPRTPRLQRPERPGDHPPRFGPCFSLVVERYWAPAPISVGVSSRLAWGWLLAPLERLLGVPPYTANEFL